MFCLYTLCFFSPIFCQEIDKNRIDKKTKSYTQLTFNGSWSWFSDPRSVYFSGEKKKVYTGWIDNYGSIYVTSYNIVSHETKTILLHRNLEIDDHNNPSILIDNNGFIHIFFTTHKVGKKPIYYLKSKKSENICEWEDLSELNFYSGNLTKHENFDHNYSNPIMLKEENNKFYLFWRGKDKKPAMATSKDCGKSWSKNHLLFLPDSTKKKTIPYTKVYSKGKDKIHFTFTNTHPNSDTVNSMYYAYYKKGFFYKANGEKIKSISELPLLESELDIVHKTHNTRVWNWDIAENKEGNPVLVYATFNDKSNHFYNYATFTNNTWKTESLINSGNWFPENQDIYKQSEPYYSGGITIDKENSDTIYLSVKKDSVFEIEKWTKEPTNHWLKQSITKNSFYHNVRPFTIKNAKNIDLPQLVWMQIYNYKHYALEDKNNPINFKDRFKTAILIGNNIQKKNSEISIETELRELIFRHIHNATSKNRTDTDFGLFFYAAEQLANKTNNTILRNELSNIRRFSDSNEDEINVSKIKTENIQWYYKLKENRMFYDKIIQIYSNPNNVSLNAFISIPKLYKEFEDEDIRLKLINYFKKNYQKFQTKIENKTSGNKEEFSNQLLTLYCLNWGRQKKIITNADYFISEEKQKRLIKKNYNIYKPKTSMTDSKLISAYVLIRLSLENF